MINWLFFLSDSFVPHYCSGGYRLIRTVDWLASDLIESVWVFVFSKCGLGCVYVWVWQFIMMNFAFRYSYWISYLIFLYLSFFLCWWTSDVDTISHLHMCVCVVYRISTIYKYQNIQTHAQKLLKSVNKFSM